MALAAAPAVASFFGGDAAAAAARTELMAQICAARSERFTITSRDCVGTPVGIDARLVVELGVTPQITTGVLHAPRATGQIGAGVAHQPVEPFRAAITALAAELDGARLMSPSRALWAGPGAARRVLAARAARRGRRSRSRCTRAATCGSARRVAAGRAPARAARAADAARHRPRSRAAAPRATRPCVDGRRAARRRRSRIDASTPASLRHGADAARARAASRLACGAGRGARGGRRRAAPRSRPASPRCATATSPRPSRRSPAAARASRPRATTCSRATPPGGTRRRRRPVACSTAGARCSPLGLAYLRCAERGELPSPSRGAAGDPGRDADAARRRARACRAGARAPALPCSGASRSAA